MKTLQNINHESASFDQLWNFATAGMRNSAEDFATSEMAKLKDPVCGAREIVMAQFLRGALSSERKSISKIFSALKNQGK